MRVCDYIADQIYQAGVEDVFIVTGGGLMFLTDGVASHPKLRALPCHHEQAVAMAAAGYAKYRGLGCGYVTTGCGGTNAVTGVLHAWQDNAACIFISGQCSTKEIIQSAPVPLRQFGMQEADIVSIVKPITKYAVTITKTEDVVYEVEKAFYLAKEGRPGPVWLDVPIDIQSALLDMSKQRHFNKPSETVYQCSEEEIADVVYQFSIAKRPVILAGQGVRLSGAIQEFREFIERNNIPYVYSRLGFDIYPNSRDLCIGCIGIRGTRPGNFAIQNADFVLVLGSRLSVCATGYNHDLFARKAKVYVVDIDVNEHKKNTVKIDRIIWSDIKYFLRHMPERQDYCDWAAICKNWKEKYPVCLPQFYEDKEGLSLYAFTTELSKHLPKDARVVTDAGSTCYVVPQAMRFQTEEQRYMPSGAQAEMGFTVPGSIGVCVAAGRKDTIGIVGDGSLQMNIQELQTIVGNKLPIKLFVWNNDGYMSIRGAQKNTFQGRYLGSGRESGVTLPDLQKICGAYGIKYIRLSKTEEYDTVLEEVLNFDGPIICEVMCQYAEWILCTWSKRTMEDGTVIRMPIEDMAPLLEREEFYANMIVKPVS